MPILVPSSSQASAMTLDGDNDGNGGDDDDDIDRFQEGEDLPRELLVRRLRARRQGQLSGDQGKDKMTMM